MQKENFYIRSVVTFIYHSYHLSYFCKCMQSHVLLIWFKFYGYLKAFCIVSDLALNRFCIAYAINAIPHYYDYEQAVCIQIK